MKYFVISDIHSFYDEMMAALTSAGFDKDNPEHILISCGDLLDRGDKTIEVLKYINQLPRERKILVKGNHEELLENCLSREEFYQHDLQNGTLKTVMSLSGHNERWCFENEYHGCFKEVKNNKLLKDYYSCLQDYAEIGKYVFVHGWIPPIGLSPRRNWRLGDWHRARWVNGMKAWACKQRLRGRTIVCGHFHTSWGHYNLRGQGSEWDKKRAIFSPFEDKGIIAIDAATAYTHKVNCLVIDMENDNVK